MMMIMMKRSQRDLLLFRALGDHRMGLYLNSVLYLGSINAGLAVSSMTVHFVWLDRLEDDSGCSRRTRLLRLCSYLQEKYKHMCRQERASIRQKRYRYAFRKALLHAANNNPDCAGKLIQELRGASRSSLRYPHQYHIAQCYLYVRTRYS